MYKDPNYYHHNFYLIYSSFLFAQVFGILFGKCMSIASIVTKPGYEEFVALTEKASQHACSTCAGRACSCPVSVLKRWWPQTLMVAKLGGVPHSKIDVKYCSSYFCCTTICIIKAVCKNTYMCVTIVPDFRHFCRARIWIALLRNAPVECLQLQETTAH